MIPVPEQRELLVNMIFSADKWDNGAEIKRYVNVSAAISFKKMENPLNNAFQLFLVPVLGLPMVDELIEIYRFGPNPNILESGSETATDREKNDAELLRLCQYANANLAFWYDFDAINVRITDAGFQRQASENNTFAPAYKYQEDKLRQNFKNKGFNMLDQVIDFLFAHIDIYPEFSFSQTYRTQTSAIVRTTAEVNDIYFINNSRLIFLRLQNHIRFVEEMHLKPVIGEKLYNQLLTWLADGSNNDDKDIEQLRLSCARYIVSLAVKRLLTETGSITDRGLYFTTLQQGKNGNEVKEPVSVDRLSVMVQNLSCDADMYRDALARYIRVRYPDYYVGSPSEVFNRDNDNKKSYWV